MLPARPTARPAETPSLRSPRARFIAAVVLLVAGDALFWLMFAAVQSDSGLARLDGPVHSALVDARTPWATVLMTAITTVTSPLWMTVIGFLAALGWAVWKREIWRPALLLGAMAVTVVLSAVIKNEIGRARPPANDFLLGPDDALSFPSGHTFGAGVFFLVLVYLLVSRRNDSLTAAAGWIAGAAAVAGTVLVAFSRLYLGYHWLTDVVASMGLAVAVTGIVILVDGLKLSKSARASDH